MHRNTILTLATGLILAVTAALAVAPSTAALACSSQVNHLGPRVDRNANKVKHDKARPKQNVGAPTGEAKKTMSDGKAAKIDITRLTRC